MRSALLILAIGATCLPAIGQNGFRTGYDAFLETVCPAANGDMLITQDVYTGVAPPFAVMRVDSLGTPIWAQHLWTVEQVTDLVETSTHDILVATSWNDSLTQRQCPAIVKMTGDGTPVWARYFICDTVPMRVGSFVRTSDGANILAVRSVSGDRLKALIRLNDDGQVVWVRKLSQDWNYEFDLVVPVESGAVLVVDRRSYYNAVMKINSSGQLLWMNEYDLNGSWISRVLDAVRMPGGEYRLLLRPDPNHLVLVSTSVTGAVLNNVNYTLPDNDNIHYAEMEVNSAGQLVIAADHGNGHEILMLTDGDGTVQWIKEATSYQIFGGDAEFLDAQHFVVVSGCNLPGTSSILFRSDAALDINSCFDPYSVAVSTTSVTITPLSYTLITPAVTVATFAPVIAPVVVGTSLPCAPLGIESSEPFHIGLFPDPATDRLNVTLPSALQGNAELVVFNALGAEVSDQVFHASGALDVSCLPPGLYVVRLLDAGRRPLGQASFMKE